MSMSMSITRTPQTHYPTGLTRHYQDFDVHTIVGISIEKCELMEQVLPPNAYYDDWVAHAMEYYLDSENQIVNPQLFLRHPLLKDEVTGRYSYFYIPAEYCYVRGKKFDVKDPSYNTYQIRIDETQRQAIIRALTLLDAVEGTAPEYLIELFKSCLIPGNPENREQTFGFCL